MIDFIGGLAVLALASLLVGIALYGIGAGLVAAGL